MSKAEELAKKYCEGSSFEDACMEKPAYIAGYHQAKKDLELTLEYQLNLRLPETLDYNGIKVDRADFIKDILKAMKEDETLKKEVGHDT